MRITVGDGQDLEVFPRVTCGEIAEVARSLGVAMETAWCGDIPLDPLHPAGTWPLLEGAHLTPNRALPCAPPRGPELLVIAGPTAGGRAPIGLDGLVVGRGSQADFSLGDSTASRAHLRVKASETLSVEDLGSLNGTTRWRNAVPRSVGRPTEARAGDVFAVGSSLVAVTNGPRESDPDPIRDPSVQERPRSTELTARLAPLAGSAFGGLMIAAMTGRWYLAILGLAYPGVMLLSQGVIRIRRPRPFWDLAALPSLLPDSRRAWSHDPPRSIAIVGDPDRIRAFARALTLAVGRRPPGTAWDEDWMRWLPDPAPGDPELVFVEDGEPPSWCDARMDVNPEGSSIYRDGRTILLPQLEVGQSEADALARSLAGERGRRFLPRHVRWADVGPAEGDVASGLTTPLGLTPSGPYSLDLDGAGPHILVAGTTGSGKSALLETLILGLALRHGPDRLGLGLIDFKGGAGTRVLSTLPHVRGLLTDLDPHLARRALKALARELEDRKTMLLAAGMSSFKEWETRGGAPPRLLIVADEYQELASQYHEFLPDLARLAAQGRSLGLHLVLATQRPAGAVTPGIRANIGTTFALRVVTDAESRDLIGTPDAAELPVDTPGRAIALTGTLRTTLQVAIPCLTPTPRIRAWGENDDLTEAAEAMAEAARARWAGGDRPAPLWLPPLPHHLGDGHSPDNPPSTSPAGSGLWIGIGDLPSERLQPRLFWDPLSGPLLVSGPPRSGRTTTLRLLSLEALTHGLRPVWLPADPREAARTIALLPSHPDVLLLIDDAHRALTLLADVDRGAPVEALTSLACSGTPLAFALPKGGAHRLAAQAVSFLVLAGGDAVDDASWSMPRELQGISGPPGRARFGSVGRWCECQIGFAPNGANDPIVASLPTRLRFDDLPEGADLAIGIGGDDGGAICLDPAQPVLLLGPPGNSRVAVEASLKAISSRRGVDLALETAESVHLRRQSAPGTGVVVMAEPTERLAREVFRGSLDGFIDPHPPQRRVLIVREDRALSVHIADPPEGPDTPPTGERGGNPSDLTPLTHKTGDQNVTFGPCQLPLRMRALETEV